MTTRAAQRAVLRSKRGFFAESLRERFFTPAAWSLRSSAAVNACSPSFRIPASVTLVRSCGLEMLAPGALCVSLTPRSLQEVFSSDLTGADCAEVRLDYLDTPQESVQARWDRLPVPVIVTCRGKQRGGQFEGSIEEEIRLLRCAVQNGAQFVDIDYRSAKPFPGAQVIASFHDFSRTPDDIEAVVDNACTGPGDVAKVATFV